MGFLLVARFTRRVPARKPRGAPPHAPLRVKQRGMKKRVPTSVWAAAASLAVVTIVQIALAVLAGGGELGWGQFLFAAVLAATLLTGLLRGSRLAWMWGRHLSLFLAVLVSARTVLAVVRGEAVAWLTAVVVLGMALPLLLASLALSRRSAIAFYELVCPLCRRESRAGADFLFRKARCAGCGNVW
jgi:hypothetical protein